MKPALRRLSLTKSFSLLLLALVASLGLATEPAPIAPGAFYQQLYDPAGPWAVNIVEADLSQGQLELRSILGGGATVGRAELSAMLSAQASDQAVPVAAVNADFFAMAGGNYTTIPLGLHVDGGELVTFPNPSRSVLYLLSDRTAHIGRLRAIAWLRAPGDVMFPLSGLNRPPESGELVFFTPRFGPETRGYDSTLQLTLSALSEPVFPGGEVSATVSAVATSPRQPIPADGGVLVASGVAAYALRNVSVGDEVRVEVRFDPDVGDIQMAVGGGPRLARDGRVSVENRAERFADSFASRRHPRTGVGLRDGIAVMVTVDGRQPGYSEGMTLAEFAQLLLNLGCTQAMNLDGGGSTTMVVRSHVVNSPSDGSQRRVANALALFSTALPTGRPVRLAIEPGEADVLCGDKLPLTALGLDEYYNPISLDPRQVTWETGPLGSIDDQGNFVASHFPLPTAGLVTARYGDLFASSVVCVLPAPAGLSLIPERITLPPKATHQFTVRAYDEDNHPIRLPAARVSWSCDPPSAGAAISSAGLLRAPAGRAELTVTARVGEVTAQAEVLVGVVTSVLGDFERPGKWSYASAPAGLPGSAETCEDPLRKENGCLRLRYDFSQGGETRVAAAVLELPLPDTRTISLRVLGDGRGCWLRARLRDAAERRFIVDLAPRVDWSNQWRELTAWLPAEAMAPVTLEWIYLTEYHPERRPAGEIFLDDIGAESPRASP